MITEDVERRTVAETRTVTLRLRTGVHIERHDSSSARTTFWADYIVITLTRADGGRFEVGEVEANTLVDRDNPGELHRWVRTYYAPTRRVMTGKGGHTFRTDDMPADLATLVAIEIETGED